MTLLERIVGATGCEIDEREMFNFNYDGADPNDLGSVLWLLKDNGDIDEEEIEIIEGIVDYQDITCDSEIEKLVESICCHCSYKHSEEFYINYGNRSYMLVPKNEIREVLYEFAENTIKSCYDLSNIPKFIIIDWDETIECYIENSTYSSIFGAYDDSEYSTDNFYYFRMN